MPVNFARLDRLRERITRITGYTAAFLLLIMCLLVLYQVFTRYVLNHPASFTEELVRYMLIWTGFVGATSAFGSRQHMALVVVLEKLTPVKKRRLMALIDAIVLLLAVVVLFVGGLQNAISSAKALSPLLGISRGFVYAITPLSAVFLTVIQLINLYEDVAAPGDEENA